MTSKPIEQVWSVRFSDGARLSTLETSIRKFPNDQRILEVKQHKGILNAAPAAIA